MYTYNLYIFEGPVQTHLGRFKIEPRQLQLICLLISDTVTFQIINPAKEVDNSLEAIRIGNLLTGSQISIDQLYTETGQTGGGKS